VSHLRSFVDFEGWMRNRIRSRQIAGDRVTHNNCRCTRPRTTGGTATTDDGPLLLLRPRIVPIDAASWDRAVGALARLLAHRLTEQRSDIAWPTPDGTVDVS
jgi:hypothetical protein